MAQIATGNTSVKTSSEAQREAFIEVFGKDYLKGFQDPIIFQNVSFFSPGVKSEYKHNFKVLSRCLFAEYVYRRRPQYNHALLDKFSELCANKLADIQKLLSMKIVQLEQTCEGNGADIDATYLDCVNKTVPIIHSSARQYVQCLLLLDRLFLVSGSAALNGVISSEQRKDVELKAKKAVRAFAGMIRIETVHIRKEGQRLLAATGEDAELGEAMKLQDQAIVEATQADDEQSQRDPASAVGDAPQADLEGIVAVSVAASKQASKAAKQPAEATS